MTLQEKLGALAGTELFGAAAGAALCELAKNSRERSLTRGEILFSKGDKANGLFVVVSGMLRAFRQTRDGREQTMHVEGPGATLAEVPVFDGGTYPSTVQAETDSVVLFVPRQSMRLFLTENPEAALAALAVLARRLRKVSGLAEQLALKDVAQRLAVMLAKEAVSQAGELTDGISFSLPLPHQSIAARLGSVREVITRQLHKLIDDGVISARGRRITVLDAARLRKRAELEKPAAQNAQDRAR
ncbi:MAG: Crp/Fnr family transcriptional regulator [Terracidiphilus sp.]